MLVTWAATVAMLFKLLRWDESRLTEEQLAGAWPPATKMLAVVVGGILCLPIHFVRTRRRPGASLVVRVGRRLFGLLLGLTWMIVVGGLSTLVSIVVETAFDLAN